MVGEPIVLPDQLVGSAVLVGDRLSIVADQLVLPVTGGIGIGLSIRGRTGICRRSVGVDLLFGYVPPAVVGVRHRLIGEPVVLPDQLVDSVVLVGDGGRPVRSRLCSRCRCRRIRRCRSCYSCTLPAGRLATIDSSYGAVKRTVLLCARVQLFLLHSKNRKISCAKI